jgi:enediyne biosynthesis protein E4
LPKAHKQPITPAYFYGMEKRGFLSPICSAKLSDIRLLLLFIPVILGCFLFSACGKSPVGASDTLFTLKSGHETGIHFANQVPDQAANGLNIIQYLYYYNGGGVAATDFNGDSLPDIYLTSNLGPDALYINRGDFKFDSVALPYPLNAASKWTTGVTYTDINSDGRTDIYVCQVGNYKSAQGRNLLYINEGNDAAGLPKFTEQAEKYGLGLRAFCTQAAFFDYDRDGDLDCYVLCHSVHSAGVYRDTAQTRKFDPLAADRLYINDGRGYFTDISQQIGLFGGIASYGLGISISDLDGDGWPDMYVGNDFHESDYLYLGGPVRVSPTPRTSPNPTLPSGERARNVPGISGKKSGKIRGNTASAQQTNTESKTSPSPSGRVGVRLRMVRLAHTSNFTMGTDAADINNDGRIDLLTLDMLPPDEYTRKSAQPVDQLDIFEYKHKMGYDYQYPRNALQINLGTDAQGAPFFAEVAQFAGVDATDWSWSPLLADFDLDGLKDIFITNGIKKRGNNLDFLKFNSNADLQRSATDLEIAKQMPEGLVKNVAFRNSGNCRFEDVSEAWGLNSNTFSNGSAYADFDLDGDMDLVVNHLNAKAQIFENTSKQANRLHMTLVGEGANTLALGARVEVVQGAQTQTFEVMATRGFESASDGKIVCGLPDKSAVQVRISWPNGEFSEQILDYQGGLQKHTIQQANALPKCTWAVPKGQTMAERENLPKAQLKQPDYVKQVVTEKLVPWRALHQNGKVKSVGRYTMILGNTPQVIDLQTNKTQKVICMGEINAAAFCDTDNDKRLELLVGVRNIPTGFGLRLLRQKGAVWLEDASFTRTTDEIAVIAPAPNDTDGILQVFVGYGQKTGAYGLAPESAIIKFDQKGVLEAPLKTITTGMVRDAHWADLNQDKNLDLVVASEWQPIQIFYAENDSFRRTEISNSSGFWQCITTTDVNGDGKMDLLAGNLGENTRLRVSEKTPARLLVGDLDGNGQQEPIVGYFHHGVQYVLPDRDLLASQMPVIKKQFPQYAAYAKAGFEQVISPTANFSSAQNLQVTLSASLAFIQTDSPEKWQQERLPDAVQWSSVHCIKPYKNGYIVAGNMYDVQPYLGRQDASPIWFCKRNGDHDWSVEVFDLVRGEVRDLSQYNK